MIELTAEYPTRPPTFRLLPGTKVGKRPPPDADLPALCDNDLKVRRRPSLFNLLPPIHPLRQLSNFPAALGGDGERGGRGGRGGGLPPLLATPEAAGLFRGAGGSKETTQQGGRSRFYRPRTKTNIKK